MLELQALQYSGPLEVAHELSDHGTGRGLAGHLQTTACQRELSELQTSRQRCLQVAKQRGEYTLIGTQAGQHRSVCLGSIKGGTHFSVLLQLFI